MKCGILTWKNWNQMYKHTGRKQKYMLFTKHAFLFGCEQMSPLCQYFTKAIRQTSLPLVMPQMPQNVSITTSINSLCCFIMTDVHVLMIWSLQLTCLGECRQPWFWDVGFTLHCTGTPRDSLLHTCRQATQVRTQQLAWLSQGIRPLKPGSGREPV